MTDDLRQRALATWNIPHWSDGYVDIDDGGQLLIRPDAERTIVLSALVHRLIGGDLRLPLLIRFNDILHERVNSLCAAFNGQIRQQAYRGHYTAVYPIKVNQQRRVVEEIMASQPAADNAQVGLEAGSKPELLAVLALAHRPGFTIICNGYKDEDYIRLALLGQKLGHRVFIVVEKPSELPLILAEARHLNIQPRIGVRARLATIGRGNWQNTGGEKSKFGLSASQILAVVQQLKAEHSLECLQMLHFHLGSQIANIRDIQTGLRESARFYHELRVAGAPITTIDVGGGLGVDYEGTRSRSACSINYSMEEYARHVVQAFAEICQRHDLPHPELISESGRALTAHHAVLVTNIIDREMPWGPADGAEKQVGESAPADLRSLRDDYHRLGNGTETRSLVEIFHDAVHAISEIHTQFAHGLISLSDRALAEQFYTGIGRQLQRRLNPVNRAHRAVLDELNEKLAEKLFLNLSVFQSLPDVWGIDQIFPILPLQGLHRPATRRAVVQDMTCDSDGRIDHYVDGQGIETTLPLPEQDHDGLMAFFLTGAYQEILGDMHNLFGVTDAVDLSLDANGEAQIQHARKGQTTADVLEDVNFDPNELMRKLTHKLSETDMSQADQAAVMASVRDALQGYTYLGSSLSPG